MWLIWGNSTADICVVPIVIGYHLTLHHISMSWSFSSGIFLLSSTFCHIYTNVLLAAEQCFTSFWHLCGNQFYELTSRLWFQPIRSYYSLPFLRCHWGLYQKQLVETHQIQDGMVYLLSCYSKLLSKGWSLELDSLPAFPVVLDFNKFHISKTLQLGFWLYYISFIMWVWFNFFTCWL